MKAIAALPLLFILSSCGLFKSTFKHKEVRSEVTRTTLDSSRDSSGATLDRSEVRTVITNVTVTELPDRTVTGSVKADRDRLKKGVIAIDSAGVKVSITLDTVTNLLRVMASAPGGRITSTTSTDERRKNDIAKNSVASSSQKESTETSVKEKVKTVRKEPVKMGVLAAIALGGIAIVSFFIWLYFRLKK